jgi:superfamily II DNA or RNA helicase
MLHESNLRPYQQMMIDHIVDTPKCAAWAFMGAGKSVSTLTAIDRMMLAGVLNKPTLIIAPLRVARDVWPEEVRGWSQLQHLRVVSILGTPSQRLAALQ